MRDKILLLTLLTVLFFGDFLTAQEWVWPTNASRLLTSSFAEVRPRRYHAGWDVKTWGKTGYPVYAMRDGYIWRVRVSPFGYGKVVYIKHDNGYYTVYAHLSGFYKPLEKLIREQQLKTQEYIQQFYFKPGELPVRQGMMIGKTGDTGIGYPHLHFEIRNQKHEPVNPVYFLKQFVTDQYHPEVRAVAFIPANINTTLDFQSYPLIFNNFEKNKNQYVIPDLPLVTGPFSISLYAIDRMKKQMNRLFYHRVELYVDSILISQMEYDTLNYSFNHHVDLERNYYLMRHGMKRFQNFYKNKHFKLSFFKQLKNDGWISQLANGVHSFSIKIYDIKENTTHIHGNFIYAKAPPEISFVSREPDSLFLKIVPAFPVDKVRISHFYKKSPLLTGKPMDISSPDGFEEPVLLHLEPEETDGYIGSKICLFPEKSDQKLESVILKNDINGDYVSDIRLDEVVEIPDGYNFVFTGEEILPQPANMESLRDAYHAVWFQKSLTTGILALHKENFIFRSEINVHWQGDTTKVFSLKYPQIKVKARQEKTIFSEDSLFRVQMFASTVYDSVYLHLWQAPAEDFPGPEGYPLLTAVYGVESQVTPFENVAKVGFRRISLPDEPGVFPAYFDQVKNKWFFLPHETTADSLWLRADVLSMEFFSVLQDSVSPVIEPLNFQDNAAIKIKDLTLTVRDDFSGIFKMEQIRVFVNGGKQLFEYDPELDKIIIPDWALTKGRIRLVVFVTDNAGISAEKSYTLELQ